ncbi:hypothetical protein [Bacillus cereus]|uniref:hypothetical protein n=1 Tax=Bacillus cereus TaxID=1396 RepID=UPI0027D2B55C|nr:hypothetical protein [Bacillus cereus]
MKNLTLNKKYNKPAIWTAHLIDRYCTVSSDSNPQFTNVSLMIGMIRSRISNGSVSL